MHIVMLSDLETTGGAAIAASRLAEALCGTEQRVTRIVAQHDRRQHPWATLELWPSLAGWAMRRMLPSAGWRRFSTWSRCRQLAALLTDLRPDIINVHNLHNASLPGWTIDLVRVCAAYAPTIWTLHDMWSFTGRCAYNYDCRKFLAGCDANCPTPTEYPALEPGRIAGAWQQRRQLFRDLPQLAAVAPSAWLRDEALEGLWAEHCVEVIPYGLPLDIYRHIDRSRARAELGLQSNGPILMAAAQQLTERRKGGNLLVEALKHVRHRPITLLTFGHGQLDLNESGIHVRALGYVQDEWTQVLAYNAADVCVHPAPVDNLPNTVMEAIACGTPVVAFPIGGVPEMVRPGHTGWLAETVSSESLATAIDGALDNLAHGIDLRSSCRAVAEAEYGDGLQAQRYLNLFEALLT